MLKHWDKIVLVCILVLVAGIFYFVFTNKKDTKDQNSLLLDMAEQLLGKDQKSKVSNHKPKEIEKEEEPVEETEEDGPEIVRIAEKLYFNKGLTAQESEFEEKFTSQILEEFEFCKQLYPLVDKFVSGSTDFNDQEKEFYEANKDQVDNIVQDKKHFSSVIKKLTEATNDITDEEREYYTNNTNLVDAELKRIRSMAGASPPLAAGERLKTILSFFEDGIPKTVTDLASLYAQKTGTKPNKGNMSTIFGKLADEGKLQYYKPKGSNKVYHGLPEWFDGKKLKQEYKSKIS